MTLLFLGGGGVATSQKNTKRQIHGASTSLLAATTSIVNVWGNDLVKNWEITVHA